MKKQWIKWTIAGLSLLSFIGIAINLDRISNIDNAIYGLFYKLHSPLATSFFTVCTQFVGPIVLLAISLTLLFILPKKEYRIPLLLNLSAAILLNMGLKHVFLRPRPTDVIHFITETGYSFPSGHSMAATCFYGFLIYLSWQLCRNKALRNVVTMLLSLVIALVCSSRIYLGVHYFSDVFAGICISICYLVIFISLVNRFFMFEETPALKHLKPNNHNQLLFSFVYAFNGILTGVKSERNMVIHFSAIATVVVFGTLFNISQFEWIACIILFGIVVMAELMNTAVETIVDMICPTVDPRARIAKDTAAGAVLMVAVASTIVGLIIFIPKILALMTM